MIPPDAGLEIGVDPQPIAVPFDGSRRLWSLWDMINHQCFGLVGWLKIFAQEQGIMRDKVRMLASLLDLPEEQASLIPPDNYSVTSFDVERLSPFLSYALRISDELNLDSMRNRIRRFEVYLRPTTQHSPQGILRELETLRDALEDDVRFKYFYFYPDAKARFLLRADADWRAVFEKFPSATDDAKAAIDCYALGHNIACVFHCMMALEYGLRALAIDVGLTFTVEQWNTIIEQIENKITTERKTLPRGSEKNERLQFLSAVAKEFFYFKDGWRNYVSHGRAAYDEQQAYSILEHVRAFMSHLAAHLSE